VGGGLCGGVQGWSRRAGCGNDRRRAHPREYRSHRRLAVVALRASGADTFFLVSGGKFASQALCKSYDIGWRPQIYTVVSGSPRDGVLGPAGLETAVGLITAYYGKRPDMRGMRDDPAMKDYFAWARKWYPDGNAEDAIVNYGYQTAQALEYVLRRCGDELTRAN